MTFTGHFSVSKSTGDSEDTRVVYDLRLVLGRAAQLISGLVPAFAKGRSRHQVEGAGHETLEGRQEREDI